MVGDGFRITVDETLRGVDASIRRSSAANFSSGMVDLYTESTNIKSLRRVREKLRNTLKLTRIRRCG